MEIEANVEKIKRWNTELKLIVTGFKEELK
jgi:hypothetical protein